MTDNFFSGIMNGPSGPETKRVGDDTWGKVMEEAMAGNDDEGFIEKTRILAKYSFPMATMFAMGDIILVNNKGGLPVALQRIKFHYVPWMGATVAYTAAVNVSCSLRGGKTDQKNHVAGGFAAGAVVGKCARCSLTGFLTGAVLAAFGWHYKDSRIKNFPIFPDVEKMPQNHGNAFSHKLDFTTVGKRLGYRPGYWARTPEEAEEVFKRGQLSDGNSRDRMW